MPKMPPKPCTAARCNNMATKNGRCEDHNIEAWASNKGKSAHSRGYGYGWKKLRNRILKRDDYLCQSCLRADIIKEAKEVDHILNKKRGGTDHESNLEALCCECHKKKTQSERNDGRHKASTPNPYAVD